MQSIALPFTENLFSLSPKRCFAFTIAKQSFHPFNCSQTVTTRVRYYVSCYRPFVPLTFSRA